MENIYYKLLKTPKNVENPNYYEILDFTPSDFRLSSLEGNYKEQLQKLQRLGNNPKYKEAILFLKGELRKARSTLEDPKSKHEYDVTLKKRTLEQIRNQIKLFALKKYMTHHEKQYLQNTSKKHAISWTEVDNILKEKKLTLRPIPMPKVTNKTLNKDLFYLSLMLLLTIFYNQEYFLAIFSEQNPNTNIVTTTETSKNTQDENKTEIETSYLFDKKNIPPQMVYIPAGDFYMGDNKGNQDENPVRKVYLDAFYISKYEVTNKEYLDFVKETDRAVPYSPQVGIYEFNWDPIEKTFPPGKENHPVVLINWQDAMEYCRWLSQKKQLYITLPTEAQWEKAARGEDSLAKYPWGDFTKNNKYYANYAAGDDFNLDGFVKTCLVFSFSEGCSPFGCYNMSGNVREWCLDNYDPQAYQALANKNPINTNNNQNKVLRGGSWGDKIESLRVSSRYYANEKDKDIYNGFRYVITIQQNGN